MTDIVRRSFAELLENPDAARPFIAHKVFIDLPDIGYSLVPGPAAAVTIVDPHAVDYADEVEDKVSLRKKDTGVDNVVRRPKEAPRWTRVSL